MHHTQNKHVMIESCCLKCLGVFFAILLFVDQSISEASDKRRESNYGGNWIPVMLDIVLCGEDLITCRELESASGSFFDMPTCQRSLERIWLRPPPKIHSTGGVLMARCRYSPSYARLRKSRTSFSNERQGQLGMLSD